MQFAVLLFLALFSLTANAQNDIVERIVKERGAHYFELYKDLHRNPELGNEEKETSAKIAQHLRTLGINVIENIGGYGLVGIISNGQGSDNHGPIGMIRADMDALPLQEATNVPYASRKPGVMHACGHDAHMATLLAVAEAFQRTRAHWRGTLYFVFQPAEEIGVGAKAMLDDGLFERLPKPDYAIAIHAFPHLTTDSVYLRAGDTLASVDSIDITFKGKGGHGAAPHTAVDPITLGSSFVLDIQRVVAREINPLLESVVTIGSFQSGTTHNIIPETAKLQLTVRAYDDEVRAFLLQRISDVATGISRSHRARDPDIVHLMGMPSVYNNPILHDRVRRSHAGFQDIKVVDAPKTMAGEDFSYYFKQGGIPSFFYWVGAQSAATPKPWPNAHSPTYAPDFPGFMKTGLKSVYWSVMDLQNSGPVRLLP